MECWLNTYISSTPDPGTFATISSTYPVLLITLPLLLALMINLSHFFYDSLNFSTHPSKNQFYFLLPLNQYLTSCSSYFETYPQEDSSLVPVCVFNLQSALSTSLNHSFQCSYPSMILFLIQPWSLTYFTYIWLLPYPLLCVFP